MSSLRDLVPQFDADGNPIDANGNPADPFGPQIDAMNQPDDSETMPDPNADEPPPPSPPVPPTPEAPQTVEPPDQSGRNDILRQIAELNAKKSPWLEQNKGIYQQVSGLQSLLGEEDRRTNNEYERKLQEQTMYGKNMTNQQKVDAQRYGYDQRYRGLIDATTLRGDTSRENNQNTNDTRLHLGDQSDATKNRLGDQTDATRNTLGNQSNDTKLQLGRFVHLGNGAVMDTVTGKITTAPKQFASEAPGGMTAQDQAQLKLLASKASDLRKQLYAAQDPETKQDIQIALSQTERKQKQIAGAYPVGGTAGTVTSTTSAPAGPDATISAPTTGNTTGGLHGQVTPPDDSGGPNEGDIQQKGNARRVFQGGQWVPYSG